MYGGRVAATNTIRGCCGRPKDGEAPISMKPEQSRFENHPIKGVKL